MTLGTLSTPVAHASSVVSEPTRNWVCVVGERAIWGNESVPVRFSADNEWFAAAQVGYRTSWEGSVHLVGAGCPEQCAAAGVGGARQGGGSSESCNGKSLWAPRQGGWCNQAGEVSRWLACIMQGADAPEAALACSQRNMALWGIPGIGSGLELLYWLGGADLVKVRCACVLCGSPAPR